MIPCVVVAVKSGASSFILNAIFILLCAVQELKKNTKKRMRIINTKLHTIGYYTPAKKLYNYP